MADRADLAELTAEKPTPESKSSDRKSRTLFIDV